MKDASETGVEISLWYYDNPLSPLKFDISKFYRRLLCAGVDTADKETVTDDDIAMRMQYAGEENSFDSILSQVS